MSQRATKSSGYHLAFLAIIGLLAGYIWTTSIPNKVYLLVHRGLRRHGFDLDIYIKNRRPLSLRGRQKSEKYPVQMENTHDQLVKGFGEPMYRYFVTRDKDGNGFLDPDEFREFLRLTSPILIPYQANEIKTMTPSKSDVEMVANFIPLKLDTLTKAFHESYATNLDYFRTFVKWTKPHRKLSRFSVADLVDLFFPKEAQNLKMGEAYYILKGKNKTVDFKSDLTDFTNRYYLPTLSNHREKVLSQLLAAFHPRAFPCTRYPPSGSAGIISAINKEYIQILFRLHVEFQLNEPPDYPFWFTPSYFLGQITFKRDLSRVVAFHLDIPKERTLNVDMEWLQKNGGSPYGAIVEVDIGYTPKMQLRMKNEKKLDEIKWDEEMPKETAFKHVERRLYNFKQVEYLPFREAFTRAKSENKLVHSVILWGSLDDQSC